MEHKMLASADYIEHLETGNTELTLNILGVLEEHFRLELDKVMHPEDYYDEPDEEADDAS